MLDITLFRDEKQYYLVLDSEKKRNKSLEHAQKTKEYDDLWKKAKSDCEQKKAEKNKITKDIADRAKKKENIDKEKEQSKKLDEEIKDLEKKQIEYLELRDKHRYAVGNILLDSVPIGNNEESNVVTKIFGEAKVQKKDLENFKKLSNNKMKFTELKFEPKSHVDLGLEKNLFDLERAAKIAGARQYYLKNKLAILHFSILRFVMDKMMKKGYNLMYTPFMISHDAVSKAAELSDFADSLYKVGEDHFLNATAEQTVSSYHMDEIFRKEELPLKYVGFATSFRREAGSASKDTRGIFRVHQFDKVEQYVFCLPEDSEKMHNEMVKNEEEIMQDLELPYRIINICSGDMNDTAAKKQDIEIWMPVQGTFRELTSASITTDYQTRKLNIRYEDKGERKVVHSLNATAIPSPRVLVAIIENHQDEKGIIHIPKALQPYTGFKEI